MKRRRKGLAEKIFDGHQQQAEKMKKLLGAKGRAKVIKSIQPIDLNKVRARRQRQGVMWVDLGVEALATDKPLRSAVAKHLITHVDWPREPPPKSAGQLGRGSLWNPRKRLQVEATIVIDAYLTNRVPKKLRERVFFIRSEGEALVRAADMYRRIYEENEKLGGERWRDPDTKTRAKKQGGLVNRGFEPYVWGHDIGDLVFEAIFMRWLPPGGKNLPPRCRITFGIGS